MDQICLDEKGQPWKCGVAARDALAKWIANRAIRCDDEGPDRVHPERRIGVCIVEGTNISLNQWLVREGWALNFEPYAKGRFLADQADRRGIWKGCFAAPTDWRNWRKPTAKLMGPTCDTSSRVAFSPKTPARSREAVAASITCPAAAITTARRMLCTGFARRKKLSLRGSAKR
jgi:hypothetical protein